MARAEGDDGFMHQDMHEASDYRRIEVITGRRKRRTWTAKEKAAIVAASAEPGINISDVARRWGINRGLLSVWRRQAGLTTGIDTNPGFVPITVSAAEPADALVRGSRADSISVVIGRVELEFGGARLVMTGSVDPALAAAVVTALRGGR